MWYRLLTIRKKYQKYLNWGKILDHPIKTSFLTTASKMRVNGTFLKHVFQGNLELVLVLIAILADIVLDFAF